jgi:TatD DNase family protein
MAAAANALQAVPRPPAGLFDTHCHLDAAEFAVDRTSVIGTAVAAGLSAILVPGVEVGNFAAVKALTTPPQAMPATGLAIYPAYGIHPMYTPRATEHDIAVLRRWLAAEAPLAVGEIGLDGFVPGLDMARQEWFLAEQLKLARDFDLPVLLHIRRAQDLVLKHLRKIRVRGGIAHAFNGSRQQAEEFIKLGFKLGVGGAMTFAGSTRIRALVRDLPLDCLVLETDAPDIPPAWLSGGRNAPAELARIAAVLAELRGEPLERIAGTTFETACALLLGPRQTA